MKTYLTTLVLILSFSFAFANENTSLLSYEAFFNTSTNEESAKLITFIKTINTVDIDNVSVHGFCDDSIANKDNYFTTDSRGKKTKKKNLSQVRTKFVHDYSVKQRVNASRIIPKDLKRAYKLSSNNKDNIRVE